MRRRRILRRVLPRICGWAALAAAFTAQAQATPIRIVASGQESPAGGSFDRFDVNQQPVLAPVNGKGQVAFFAKLARGPADEGIFLGSPTGIVKVAQTGDRVPGGGEISGFASHPLPALNDQGQVAFVASVSGGRGAEGIFLAASGGLKTVARAGGKVPDLPGAGFAELHYPSLSPGGEVVFLATVRRGREGGEGIFRSRRGVLGKLVASGDPVPGGGSFGGFGVPAVNASGQVVFPALVEQGAVVGGLFLLDKQGIRLLLGAGSPSPAGGIFAQFSERVGFSDSGQVAFAARLKDASSAAGVFVWRAQGLRTVALLGDDAPSGGKFAGFGPWPAMSHAGQVAFAAAVDGGPAPVAIFAEGPDGLARRIAVGDTLPDGQILHTFGLSPVLTLNGSGGISFVTSATPTGQGREAIYYLPPAGSSR